MSNVSWSMAFDRLNRDGFIYALLLSICVSQMGQGWISAVFRVITPLMLLIKSWESGLWSRGLWSRGDVCAFLFVICMTQMAQGLIPVFFVGFAMVMLASGRRVSLGRYLN